MSDHIEHKCDRCGSYTCRGYTCQEAEILRLSDEVVRLEAANQRLREALGHAKQHIHEAGDHYGFPCSLIDDIDAALEGDGK